MEEIIDKLPTESVIIVKDTNNKQATKTEVMKGNPFIIPQHMRLFSNTSKIKKEPKEPFIMDEAKTVCDIDETFFNIIEGRPLRQFSDIKVYMTNIRDITLFKANAAYLKDQMIQIDTAKSDELEEYENIERMYNSIKSSFVNFAKESFDSAKRREKLCKEREYLVDMIIEKLNELSFTYNKLRNEVDSLEAVFEILSKYGEFLYHMSPASWKNVNTNIFLKKQTGVLRALFSDIYTPSTPTEPKFNDFITMCNNNQPKLYFKRPAQLIHIFEELSKQCLNYMQVDVVTTNIKSTVLRRRDFLRAIIENEADEVTGIISYYEKQVQFLEFKETEYKTKFYRLLSTQFHDLYASYDATKIFTCLQYVHTQVLRTQEDPKDSITTLAHNLENLYIEIMSQFDALDQKVVKSATRELFAEDRKMMKRALFAQRTLKECDILTKSLYSSFESSRRQRQ
ncbi:unnamed protein product [Leptosia nina]|uniref:Uncharacterized protein n=1 Tax=Leptosia nina TaxID=320188 RepID=A0AAV1IU71_9NEOP